MRAVAASLVRNASSRVAGGSEALQEDAGCKAAAPAVRVLFERPLFMKILI